MDRCKVAHHSRCARALLRFLARKCASTRKSCAGCGAQSRTSGGAVATDAVAASAATEGTTALAATADAGTTTVCFAEDGEVMLARRQLASPKISKPSCSFAAHIA